MKKEESENALRYCARYRGHKLYVLVGDSFINLAMANQDEFRTTAGLALMERLLTELLSEGRNLEEIAGIAWECSLRADDLPRIIQDAILWYIDRREHG